MVYCHPRASSILNSKFSIPNYLAVQFLIQNSTFLITSQLGSCPIALRLTKQKTAVPDMRHRSLIFPELSSAQRASPILNSKFPIQNYPAAQFLIQNSQFIITPERATSTQARPNHSHTHPSDGCGRARCCRQGSTMRTLRHRPGRWGCTPSSRRPSPYTGAPYRSPR